MNATDIITVCHGLKEVEYKRLATGLCMQKAIAVFNIPSSLFAAISNAVILAELTSNRRLQTTANILTCSLCVTDVLVGAIVQPLFIAIYFSDVADAHYCTLRNYHSLCALVCCGCSMLTLNIVSLDRYLAICHPYWYHATDVRPRYIAIIVTTWIIWIFLTVLPFTHLLNPDAFFFVISVITVITALFISFCYIKIYLVIRSKIHCGTPAESNSMNERRNTRTIGIILGTFYICYIPLIVLTAMSSFKQMDWQVLQLVSPWLETCVYLNSSFNPLIYCYRMTDIRKAVWRRMGLLGVPFVTNYFQENTEASRARASNRIEMRIIPPVSEK